MWRLLLVLLLVVVLLGGLDGQAGLLLIGLPDLAEEDEPAEVPDGVAVRVEVQQPLRQP